MLKAIRNVPGRNKEGVYYLHLFSKQLLNTTTCQGPLAAGGPQRESLALGEGIFHRLTLFRQNHETKLQ